MPKISDEIIRAVTGAARIEDVVGDFVKLRKAGVNMTGLCPFHADQHDGNFIVRPSSIGEARHGNTYRCFVCDAKGGPVQFLMNAEHMTFPDAIRWLGKKYCIEVDNVPMDWTPPPPQPTPPPPPDLEIPRAYVKRTMDIATWWQVTFRKWYMTLPWNMEQLATANDTLWQYCIGGWNDGRVVFWMIDHTGVPRAAKIMAYKEDGHRDKDAHPSWIYNQDGCRQQLKPDEHTILKPLFGSHLLAKYPNAAVNIVESEKTAVVMANYYRDFERQIWLACGGLQHLRLEAMQPLIDQGRTVWLWPDKDGRDKWQEVADKLGSEKVHLYTNFFDTCWRDVDGDKADVADIAIRMMQTGEGPRKDTGEGQGATDRLPAGGPENGATLAIEPVEWNSEEPFIDTEEMADPRVREWREILRNKYNFNKSRNERGTETSD